jgi:hypothetical protein
MTDQIRPYLPSIEEKIKSELAKGDLHDTIKKVTSANDLLAKTAAEVIAVLEKVEVVIKNQSSTLDPLKSGDQSKKLSVLKEAGKSLLGILEFDATVKNQTTVGESANNKNADALKNESKIVADAENANAPRARF